MKTRKRNKRNPKVSIKGLRITPSRIEKVKDDVKYLFADLDLLLTQHKEQISIKLFDDLFLDPKTLDVIEYRGNSYAIELN